MDSRLDVLIDNYTTDPMMSRPSLEFQQEKERILDTTNSLKTHFEQANEKLRLVQNQIDLNKLDSEECGIEFDETENRDPAVIAANLAAQNSFLRKLKYQYLEQNAKDRYVKSIVSDIDDADIATPEDIKELTALNAEKKEKLKGAKTKLSEVHNNIRTLAPLVEEDYDKTKAAIEKATSLAQKIIDARLTLTRLRQTHPHPRLTIAAADQKLLDQTVEMQELSDKVEDVSRKVKDSKEQLSSGNVDLENMRIERAEAEKLAKKVNVTEDDPRIAPLYDWFTASLVLQRFTSDLQQYQSVSDNELRLVYKIPHNRLLNITLIFLPNTRQLATVNITGVETDFDELIDMYAQTNDVHGLLAAILARARATG